MGRVIGRREQSRKTYRRRRGAVVAQVAISLTTLIGFAALAVDVGVMYNARAELQRTADASALAAAAELSDFSEGSPLNEARTIAAQYAAINHVTQQGVQLDDADVLFGRAWIDEATGKYKFEETEIVPNAVRVRVRRTENSPTGPVALYFARILGVESANIAAQATAVLTPRDIAFVLDLSTSHNDDSSLRSYKITEIANKDFWRSLKQASELQPDPQYGPFIGNMSAWGSEVTGPGWDFVNDSGLKPFARNQNWSLTSSWASQTLQSQGLGSYTSSEINAIKSSSYDSDYAYYQRRVLVALGIYRWRSGLSGGQAGGNANSYIGEGEVELMVPYPNQVSNPKTAHAKVGGNWNSFVDYVYSTSSSMNQYDPNNALYGDSNLRYRFGLKTWIDYLQEKAYGQNSPGMDYTRQQPMAAVFDAVQASIDIIDDLDSDDQIGMASYATYGYSAANKPSHMSWLTSDLDVVRTRLTQLQPGEWTTNTNVASGIDKGVDTLFDSPDARASAAKVMLLLTDGIANTIRDGSQWNEWQAKADALAAAQEAASQGVRIYTVSVGAQADTQLMAEIAEIANGEHFHASGSINEYSTALEDIFKKLGGKRPVVLIE